MAVASEHPACGVPRDAPRARVRLRDLVELTKPRLTLLVVATAATGAYVAPGGAGWARTTTTVAGTALIVGAANALNMVLERDVDARMARTRRRPLPSGRLSAGAALAFAAALAALALPLLAQAGALTTALALVALALYVGAYTPLKRRSDLALYVGAVPGAIPPLLGWTSTAGRAGAGGLLLFALLYAWQLVHFGAIALVREREYQQAGLVVVSVARGREAAEHVVRVGALLTVAASLALLATGLGRVVYGATTCLAGAGLLLTALRRRASPSSSWAWRTFLVSNAYLAVLLAGLALERARP